MLEPYRPRILLACGNNAENFNGRWICEHCNAQIGTTDEPANCKEMREEAEPFKNDYWMDINYEPEREPEPESNR